MIIESVGEQASCHNLHVPSSKLSIRTVVILVVKYAGLYA